MSEVNIYKGISEKRKQQMKEYNRKHREQCRIAQRKYYENHKEYYKSFNRNRFKEQQKEIERLNNIIDELEKWLDKEKENYNLELTKKNEKALSYSLPIKNVYREVLDKLKELRGSDK